MATEEFDLERRQELQAALSSLGAVVWAEPGDDAAGALGKSMRRFLAAAGYSPDVTRLVLAVLEHYGDPAIAEAAGVSARDLVSLIDAPAHANTQRAAVPRALKAAGYPADLTRLVLTLLEKYGSMDPVEGVQVRDLTGLVEGEGADAVKRAVKAADLPSDVQRLVTLVLDAPGDGIDAKAAVKRLLKIAGQPPAVTRSVLAVLDPAPEAPQEPPPLAEVLKKAGYPADVRRRVLAAIDPPTGAEAEVDPKKTVVDAAKRAGLAPGLRRRLAAVIDPPTEAERDVDPKKALADAAKRAGLAPEVRRRVLAALEPPAEPEGEVDPKKALVDAAKRAGLAPDVRRRVLAALEPPAEVELDPDARVADALKRAGYAPDVRRRVLAALRPPAEPEEEVDPKKALVDAAKRAGLAPEVRRRVVAALDAPAEPEGEVDPKKALVEAATRAGLALDVRRRVVAALEPPTEVELDPEARVAEAVKKAGYPADARRRVLAALEPPAEVELDPDARVAEAVKKAGYPADARRRVLAALEPPTEVEPRKAVADAVKRAGYAPDVRRRVVAALDAPAEPEGEVDPKKALVEAATRAGLAPDVRRRVVAALEPPTEVELDPEARVAEAVKKAGYPADARRRVLAALEPPTEVEPRKAVADAVKRAGYAPDVRRRVVAALDAPAEPEGEVDPKKTLVEAARRAGLAPDVRRRVLAALEPPTEAELEPEARVADALKKAGYPPDVRRRVLAAIDPPTEPEGEADPKRAVVDAAKRAGLSQEVRRRLLVALAPPADEAEVDARAVVRRTLRTTGHPPDLVRVVDAVLERHGDPDATEGAWRVADLLPLVETSTEGQDVQDVVRRVLRLGDYKPDLAQLVVSLLERYGDPDLAESGLRVADLQLLVEVTHNDFDAREPVRRILRAAGYRVDLINFFELLLERYTGSDVPVSGVRIRELSDLVEDTDEKLLSLLRHWRTATPDDHLIGNELATVLGRRGVEPGVARDLAAAIDNQRGRGELVDLARVARFALIAEDACISMAEPAWRDDPGFTKAYAEAKSISAWGRDIRWRVQTLVKAAAAARHVEGDFVECGVDTGGTARAVMAYLGDDAFTDRTFYLFDTFHGIVPGQLLPDEPAPIEDRYPDVAALARANFADKPYARIVEGIVPETLSAFTGSKVAFLHIDMNAAYPEVEALRFFWGLLSPGAPVVFDDYGFPRHRAQRRALDAVAASLGVEIMMLPTCQGILFKPPEGV